MTFEDPEGATPLDPEEKRGLKFAHITTRGELDELEQANIEQGLGWVSRRRGGSVFDDAFQRKLHKQLFGDVWSWAGEYRLTEKASGLDLQADNERRTIYIAALRAADSGDFGPLFEFVRKT